MANQRLGANLNALLNRTAVKGAGKSDQHSNQDDHLQYVAIELVERSTYQPRRDMHSEALEDLAESIKTQGIIQPIIVRQKINKHYEIIAGERRWRAAQLAGLHEVPVIIKTVSDENAVAMALIENIQRENLNPIEEAMALYRLQHEFELTQEEVAKAVGRSRTTVTNIMRLLNLNDSLKTMLEHGDLEMGHGRALLGLPKAKQLEVAQKVVAKGLSVRQTEALVSLLKKKENKQEDESVAVGFDPNITSLEEELSLKLNASIKIHCNKKGKGKLVINYNSHDELEGILEHLR